MYPLDTNINTAIERQADHVRAVQAYSALEPRQQAASSWAAGNPGRTLVVALAAPILLLLAWGLLIH